MVLRPELICMFMVAYYDIQHGRSASMALDGVVLILSLMDAHELVLAESSIHY